MSFKKIKEKKLPDIQSTGILYKHEETGAEVLYFKNNDPNKAFTIGFKTPPYSDNGITHILEHSVLNGSKKYPSKEPFVELIKGSLNTFLNAMTFSDKTIYPIASTNQKDFHHLMGVYLDAVFQPLLIENPQILEQEGWHYHLENATDDLTYKGVVYNEMKGAFASPERKLYQSIASHLYPDSIYRFESGGDPLSIPELTQKEFIAYHQKYYHPSNSQTILYGDLDLEQAFSDLEEYFNGKGKLNDDTDLSCQANISQNNHFEEFYSLADDDIAENKDFLAIAWDVARPTDKLDGFGLKVLEEILLGNNQAPLKKALLDADVGGDISGGTAEFGYPTAFYISAKYSSSDKLEHFKETVIATLTDLVKNGIPKDLVDAALNKISFQTKEMAISEDNPRGVLYAITSLSTWLYEEDPFINLEFSKYLDELRSKADIDYFEELIKDKLLNNKEQITLSLLAKPGENSKIEKKVTKELQDYKNSLSESEINSLIEKTQQLIQRQETPDKAEDLAKIPTLTIKDLNSNVIEYPITQTSFNENTSFYHAKQFTSGIDYVYLYFDIKDFNEEEYQLMGIFSQLLTQLNTENIDADELQTSIDKYTGGIKGSITSFEDQDGNVQSYFVLSGRALESSTTQLLDLMKEIISYTEFTDTNEILKIIQKMISNFEYTIESSSHMLVANRALSQFKITSKINELTQGIEQFNFLKKMKIDLENNKTMLTTELKAISEKLLNKNRLNILYTGNEEQAYHVKEDLLKLFKDLPNKMIDDKIGITPGTKQNEAYITAQDVNYVGIAANAKNNLIYNGLTNVLATATRFDYLWNEIRVKGGAYGSLYTHQRNGNFALASYRDPNIKETLAVYEQLPIYIQNLTLDEEALTKYIIGTISPLEQPKSAASKGLTAFRRLQMGISTNDLKQLKREIIDTQDSDFSQLADDFQKVIENKTTVVIGNQKEIEKQKDYFDKIYHLY